MHEGGVGGSAYLGHLGRQPQGSEKVTWSCYGLRQVFEDKQKMASNRKEGKEKAFQAEGKTLAKP